MLLSHGATPSFVEFKNSSNTVVASINTNGDINVAGSVIANGITLGGGGSTISSLDDVPGVTAPSPSSGDFLKWNGSAWINDPINLGTDTTGSYMLDVSAGTGISVSHSQSEGSTATISANAATTTSIGALYGSTTLATTYGTFLGYQSGNNFSTGSYNISIGYQAANSMGSGTGNVSVGYRALSAMTFNSYSVAIGYAAAENVAGSSNVAIGASSLRGSFGSAAANNTAIGFEAGYNVSTLSSGNVFLGYKAGYNETGNNTLYISNSNTSSPLIKGDFASSTVEINGSLTYRQQILPQGSNTAVYLTNSHKGKIVTFNTSSNVTVYINNFINLVAGERIDLLNLGTGIVNVSGFSITLNGTPGLKLRAQYSAASIVCIQNSSEFVLIGDLAA